MNNFLEITPIIRFDRELKRLIKCDEAWISDNLFDNVVKKLSVPPYSEYSIIIIILQLFVKTVSENRDKSKEAVQIIYAFSHEVNGLKEVTKILVKTLVGPNKNRVLTFEKAEGKNGVG